MDVVDDPADPPRKRRGPKPLWVQPATDAELQVYKRKFLDALARIGHVLGAAAEIGVPRRQPYKWAARDPAFAQAFEDATGGARKSLALQKIEAVSDRIEAFLEAYAQVGTMSQAAEIARVSLRTIYARLEDEPKFAEAFELARTRATDALEAECRRRAVDGIHEPVFYQGEIVGYTKRYSDVCLLALLNAYRSEKFKHRHEHTGRDGGPIAVVHVSYDHNMQPDDMVIEATKVVVAPPPPPEKTE